MYNEYLRETICFRKSDSDENGLLLSIPLPVFYKYAKEPDDTVDLLIECVNYKFCCFSEVRFTLSSKRFILLTENGEFSDQDHLFIARSDKQFHGKNIVFGLYVVLDKEIQKLNFYDSYYYLYTDTDNELFNNSNLLYSPFSIGNVYGNPFPEKTDRPFDRTSRKTSLIVDDYTKRIMGVISDYDCLFSGHNQFVVNNDDLSDLREDIISMDGLINRYSYIDGRIVPLVVNEEFRKVNQIRDQIYEIRRLQTETSKNSIRKMLFEDFASLSEVQKIIKEKTNLLHHLMEQVAVRQEEIRLTKKFIYDQKCADYLHNNKFKYYTSVCLLIKDENPYIEEWLRHYTSIGVEHFYIYDNNSKIPIRDTVHEIDNGYFDHLCTFVKFTDYRKNMQYECYDDCLSRFGKESRWMGFFDTDEFVDVSKSSVTAFLKQYEDYFCVWIPWEIHNANGRLLKRDGTMKELFPNTFTDPFGVWGKVFLQPHRTCQMFVHLAMGMHDDDVVINADFHEHLKNYAAVCKDNSSGICSLYQYARVRHYITRSFEEWCSKMKRGTCDPNFKRKFDVFFDYNPDLAYLKNDESVLKLIHTCQGYS